MNITWKDKVTNIEILGQAGLPTMKDILKQNLKCNTERMDNERLPRQLLYFQFHNGKRNQA